MKYQIIKNGQDDYTLKYKDKEINFHSDVETVTELQDVYELGKERLVLELAEKGKTIGELVKVIHKDGKTYYDHSNKDMMIEIYTQKEMSRIFQKAIKKMLGIELVELIKEIGITEKAESEQLSKELGEVLLGRFQNKGQK